MRLLDKLFGSPLASHEEEGQKVGVLAGIPMLGLDALSSSAYGPEAVRHAALAGRRRRPYRRGRRGGSPSQETLGRLCGDARPGERASTAAPYDRPVALSSIVQSPVSRD